MTRAVEELYEQASQLPAEDRAELARRLLESIEDPSDEGVEQAWAAEKERRMADDRAARVKTIPHPDVGNTYRRVSVEGRASHRFARGIVLPHETGRHVTRRVRIPN